MNVLIVSNTYLDEISPIKNLVKVLLKQGNNVILVAKGNNHCISVNDCLKYIRLDDFSKNDILSVVKYFNHRRMLRKIVIKEMANCDILWTVTDKTVRELGDIVLNYKHVMQLQELIHDLPAFPKQSIIKLNIQKYARAAFKVVVPEYNRAQIQKAWWELKNVPEILPNKVIIEWNDLKGGDEQAEEILKQIRCEKRKIILYQGVFGYDRDLSIYAEAIEQMSDKYVFYLMGKNSGGYNIDDFCRKHKGIKKIPFIPSPYHLMITKEAYIGVLPYKAVRIAHLSVLNAVFCAPNKIYEYSAFGKPMIGSNVSGLAIPFNTYKCGITIDENDISSVVRAIKDIENQYDTYSSNSYAFYNNCDYEKCVQKILED